ncbi:hypothetical protein Patl1_01460 [Pistacia atlantica]|uniref:Uncharacterized protein n=1 Tax=Pistacia atlantica TaxID=434234 RepID=A0ACC1C4H4_9ROSI|nr:hypothetical protein Patl1_01460 [Pistacia atlantica]
MEEHDHHLFLPLLSATPTTSTAFSNTTTTGYISNVDADNIKILSSNNSIISRLLSVFFIGIISIWANYEASKGFDVIIVNDSKDSLAGKRFELLYISNDKATRILLNTSAFAENILYSDTNHSKNQVHSVTLRLTAKNLSQIVTVDTSKTDEFVINLSPSIMGYANVNSAIISALQRGMARTWLWDGESRAPARLMDGLVEYITMLAGMSQRKKFVGAGELPEFSHVCWDDKDPMVVAEFLDYCEKHNNGFIQRLNQAMREGWDIATVNDALGMEAKYYCDSYKKNKIMYGNSINIIL